MEAFPRSDGWVLQTTNLSHKSHCIQSFRFASSYVPGCVSEADRQGLGCLELGKEIFQADSSLVVSGDCWSPDANLPPRNSRFLSHPVGHWMAPLGTWDQSHHKNKCVFLSHEPAGIQMAPKPFRTWGDHLNSEVTCSSEPRSARMAWKARRPRTV